MTIQPPRHDSPGAGGKIDGDLRIRRLLLVDDSGAERAILDTSDGMVQLRLIAAGAATPTSRCEVLIFAGEHEPGIYSAGSELWVDGNSVGGSTVTVQGSHVRLENF